MKTLITFFLIILGITLGNVTPSFSQSSEQLFRKGLLKEEGEGNLNEAIVIYTKIVDDSTAQISIQAKSLLRVGLCYEKLGRNEASRAYQRLLNLFPGQKAEVAIARERLSKLILNAEEDSKAPPESDMYSNSMTLLKVWSGPASIASGSPSPDGKFLSYSDPVTDNLAIRELSNGKTHLFTDEAGWDDPMQFTIGSIVSPNSLQIAYSWYNLNSNYEIRLINIDNSQPKVLYANKGENVWPCTWSPDGKTIYARSFFNKTGKCRILAVDAVNGDIQILKTFDNISWLQLSVSPDNKFIAYDFPNYKNGEFSDNDIHLVSTDGINNISLIDHPANDQILGWFPNSNQLLFKSNRSGNWDAWTIEILNGKVVGEPRRVLAEIGENASQIGFTNNGTFYYSLFLRKFNSFTASIDQIKGEVKSESAHPLLGSIRTAKWSPDGKFLAFIQEQWATDQRPLCVLNVDTGKEFYLAEWLNTRHFQWSSDCENIIAIGSDARKETENDYKGGIYAFEIESGEANELLLFSEPRDNDGKEGLLWAHTLAEWNDQQRSFYYIRKDQLIKGELESGQEEIILQDDILGSGNYNLDLSPDGENLLFCSDDKIYVIPTFQGKIFSLVDVNTTTSGHPIVYNSAVWSPDENYIFYTENGRKDGSILWRISGEGKNPTTVWQSKVPISSISIHPDGKKIVITTFKQEAEIWKVDNLLSN